MTTRIYKFHPKNLDPVTVYVEQYGPAFGRLTVQCYARAWTAYWESLGTQSVEDFITGCDTGYIADNLGWGLNGLCAKRKEKSERAYIERIAQALIDYFKG